MANERIVMLTTVDNPFDPKDQFDAWFLFDTQNGYNSCALLAHLSDTNDLRPDEYIDQEIEATIDNIVENDPLHLYKKVVYE